MSGAYLADQKEQVRCSACGVRSKACVEGLLFGDGEPCCPDCDLHPLWSPS